MHESDDLIERVAMALRGDAVGLGPDFDTRVMRRVRAESRELPGRGLWRWMTRPRTVSVSPLGALALAAGFAGIVAVTARSGDTGIGTVGGAASAGRASVPRGEQMMKFVFVAPRASRVAIVGDFNDWEEGGSPLHRVSEPGIWAITIPLAPGRYHYTFVVDGNWVADPLAPRTIEDDFGRPNSVITVGDATT